MKIKQEIDLQELKEYGFFECYDYMVYQLTNFDIDLLVNKKTKTISLFTEDKKYRNKRILQELEIIKELKEDGLIEG